ESPVAVSPNMFDLGVGAPAVTATGTITGLTQNSCNTVSVTCDIVGSVDPNNPGHPKTLSASAQDTCETCSVKVDKQIKCGAGRDVEPGAGQQDVQRYARRERAGHGDAELFLHGGPEPELQGDGAGQRELRLSVAGPDGDQGLRAAGHQRQQRGDDHGEEHGEGGAGE